MRRPQRPLAHVGWREMVMLPAFHGAPIMAKLDTGAFTSALHARQIKRFARDGQPWARFVLDLGEGVDQSGSQSGGQNEGEHGGVACEAPIIDQRAITSSNGVTEERCIITTRIVVGSEAIDAQFSLADRSDMKFPILIGRSAIKGRFVVDSGRSFLQSKHPGAAHHANKDSGQ